MRCRSSAVCSWRVCPLERKVFTFFCSRTQYEEDRLAPAGQLASPEYAAGWSAAGYETSHLAGLSPTTPASEVYAKVLSDHGDFSLEAYARRALEGESRKRQAEAGPRVTAAFGSLPTVDRIVGLGRSLWSPILSPSGHSVFKDEATGEPISLVGNVMQGLWKQLEARADQGSAFSVPLNSDTLWHMAQANNTRLLNQAAHGWVQAWGDFAAVGASALRALTPAPLTGSAKRTALWVPVDAGVQLYNAFRGAFRLASDFLSGKAGQALKWSTHPETQAWLAANAYGPMRDPYTEGAWIRKPTSVLTAGATSLLGGLTSLLVPKLRHGQAWADLLKEAMDDSRPLGAQGVSAASERRMRTSRLVAKTLLITGEGGKNGAFVTSQSHKGRRVGAAEVSNITGQTCLFSYLNDTVLTYPLCDTCPALDEILGRVQRSVYSIMFFFGTASPTCPNCTLGQYPSFNYTVAQFNASDTYFRNPNAAAIVGNSADNPVGWPYAPSLGISNWNWFDDPTPNKTGFAVVEELWNATMDYVRGVVPAIGPTPIFSTTTYRGAAAEDPWARAVARVQGQEQAKKGLSDSPIHAPMRNFLATTGLTFASWLSGAPAPLPDVGKVGQASVVPIPTGPFTTLREVALAWFDYFLSFILCPYPQLFENVKRFSLGVSLILYAALFFVLVCISLAIFPGQLFLSAALSTLITTGFILATWIALTYDYGLLCFVNIPPALPSGFWDDLFYMFAYTIFPKCSILYGVVSEDWYSNGNCYPCANWKGTDGFTVPNYYQSAASGGQFGFSDLRYNLAFILKAAFPSIWTALRPGGYLYNAPILGLLLRSSFIQGPLATYQNFDPNTVSPRDFRTFWQGGTWVTLPANFFLAAGIAYLIWKLLGPFILQTLAFLFAVMLLIIPLALFCIAGVFSLLSFGMMDDLVGPSGGPMDSYDPVDILKQDYKEQQQRRRAAQMNEARIQMVPLLMRMPTYGRV